MPDMDTPPDYNWSVVVPENNINSGQLETIMAPPKTAKNNDAKITDYFKAEKKKQKKSKAKNPLTEEQKLKRFQGSAIRSIILGLN